MRSTGQSGRNPQDWRPSRRDTISTVNPAARGRDAPPRIRSAPQGTGALRREGRTLVQGGLSLRVPRYANRDDLLTGFGSRSAGARWNPPRGFPTVYASLDPHTALDEVLAHFRHYGLPIESAMPRVTVSVRVRLARVLDLTNGPTRSTLRVSARRMLDEPWREQQAAGREALIQAIGRLVRELDWEGLLVLSAARTDGVNLILFPDNLARGSALEIVNADELPHRP